jgi:plastocyanin
MPQAAYQRGIQTAFGHRAACALGVFASLMCSAGVAGSLSITASQRTGLAIPGAVITLEALSPALPPAPPVRAVLDQVDLAFVPDVLVVPVHSSVQFPNSDAVSHQVYSFSPAKSFQLPLYRGKPYPPMLFEKPGVITLGCNIHDDMLAYLIVTDAPWFGRTDSRGQFWVADLPEGRYRARLWHPRLAEAPVERIVEMNAADQKIQLMLKRNLRPAPLGGKPRSWDY